MKIAVLSDIHGNIRALEAVLRTLDRAGPDLVVVGGDVAYGPFPAATTERLADLDPAPLFVMGNADRELVASFDGTEIAAPPHIRRVMDFCVSRLSKSDRDFLAGFRPNLTVDHPALGRILFCHATPDSDCAVFSEITLEERIAHHFSALDAPTVVCGHTHMQFDRRIAGKRVANAGSVGKPYGERGAFWILIDRDIEFRSTPYDFAAAAEEVRRSGHPYADEFADEAILEPPARDKVLEWLESRVE
ncbi:metallophosphoesterase family protein [Salinispira pacifica]